jgi:Zn-dependent metalloprotease
MNADGTGERCLTCNRTELPNRHTGNPAWHPSGEFIVFQAQKANAPANPISDYFANPGSGINNDIWVMDAQGTRFWRLTDVQIAAGGVLHPHFSPTGDRLLWSELVGAGGGSIGEWALHVADFRVVNGLPRIENLRRYQPGQQHHFYESHGFSPNGAEILFSGNLEPGQAETAGDIYTLNLETGALNNLTSTMNQWDEHSQISPNGQWIVWMTSMGIGGNPIGPRTDYWLMRPDGSSKRQITFFNDPSKPEHRAGGAIAADSSWSPDGSRLLAYVILDVSTGKAEMLLLDFSVALGARESPQVIEDPQQSSAAPVPSMTAVPVVLEGAHDLAHYAWSRRIDQMAQDRQLSLVSVTPDPFLPGRRHERYIQIHDGVPIVGAGVTRQLSDTHTYSAFGTLYRDVRGDVTPAFDATGAAERLGASVNGAVAMSPDQLALVVLPGSDRASWTLAYEARVVTADDILMCHLDAHTGAMLSCRTDLQLRNAGPGKRARLAERLETAAALASQSAAPPEARRRIVYDMRGEARTALEVLTRSTDLSWIEAFGPAPTSDRDVAAATADTAVRLSLQHVITRLGWNPFGNDPPIVLVHPNDLDGRREQLSLFTRGPFYAGRRTLVFPDEPEVRAVSRSDSSIAAMAHELGHAVIDVTSRLLYRGESGALNEAFAHIVSEGIVPALPDAAAGSVRAREGAATNVVLRVFDAVAHESGTAPDRSRVDSERVFMRAFTLMLPADATLSMARRATLQAARDLEGGRRNLEARLAAAWTRANVR